MHLSAFALTDSALAPKKSLVFHFLLVFSLPRQYEPRTEPTELAISSAVGDALIGMLGDLLTIGLCIEVMKCQLRHPENRQGIGL
jgi:hypothetical protein